MLVWWHPTEGSSAQQQSNPPAGSRSTRATDMFIVDLPCPSIALLEHRAIGIALAVRRAGRRARVRSQYQGLGGHFCGAVLGKRQPLKTAPRLPDR